MSIALVLLQTKSDLEQGEAELVIAVVLRGGYSGFVFWWESALVVGSGLLKPTATASSPKHIHLCSIHHDLASRVHVAAFWFMLRCKLSTCHHHPSSPSSPHPSACLPLQRRRAEQDCALWYSLDFTSGPHRKLWHRFCFLIQASWSFTCMWVCNKLCQCLGFLAKYMPV